MTDMVVVTVHMTVLTVTAAVGTTVGTTVGTAVGTVATVSRRQSRADAIVCFSLVRMDVVTETRAVGFMIPVNFGGWMKLGN